MRLKVDHNKNYTNDLDFINKTALYVTPIT